MRDASRLEPLRLQGPESNRRGPGYEPGSAASSLPATCGPAGGSRTRSLVACRV